MSTSYLYQVCGLTLQSEVEFPELLPSHGTPDAVLIRGAVPASLSTAAYTGPSEQVDRDSYLLNVDGIARYWVRSAREVVVDVVPGAPDYRVRMFFLGSVLTTLLHRNGFLVLHAGGVLTARGVVVIAGHRRRGKSTLVASLGARGYPIIGDDLMAVSLAGDGRPVAHPGLPHLKLWRDTLTRAGRSEKALLRVSDDADKFIVPQQIDRAPAPVAIDKLFILALADRDDVGMDVPSGRDAFGDIKTYTRNPEIVNALGLWGQHFRIAAAVAARVPIVRLARPRAGDSVEAVVEAVQRAIAAPPSRVGTLVPDGLRR